MMKAKYRFIGIIASLLIVCLCFAGSQTLSGDTAADIITRAQYLTNSSGDTSMWVDDEFLSWLNDGQADIVRTTWCLQGTESINLVQDQAEYDITADYVRIQLVQYIDSTPKTWGMVMKNPVDFNSTTTGTRPAYWFDWNEKITVWPVPTASSGQVKLFYIPRLAKLTATTDAITIPAIYEEALLKYVVAMAWTKDRQYGKANAFLTMYKQELADLSGRLLGMPGEVPK